MVVDLSTKITKLRFPPLLPSYPKLVSNYLKQVLVFTVDMYRVALKPISIFLLPKFYVGNTVEMT